MFIYRYFNLPLIRGSWSWVSAGKLFSTALWRLWGAPADGHGVLVAQSAAGQDQRRLACAWGERWWGLWLFYPGGNVLLGWPLGTLVVYVLQAHVSSYRYSLGLGCIINQFFSSVSVFPWMDYKFFWFGLWGAGQLEIIFRASLCYWCELPPSTFWTGINAEQPRICQPPSIVWFLVMGFHYNWPSYAHQTYSFIKLNCCLIKVLIFLAW